MQNETNVKELRARLDLLRSHDLTGMGYEAKASHRRRVERIEQEYERALARLKESPATHSDREVALAE